jgi:hypothetical protein
MIPDEHLCRLRNAIYLNNTAVTFMEYAEHDKATDVLAHALILIKSLLHAAPESTSFAEKADAFAQRKVKDVQKCLAQLRKAHSIARSSIIVMCYDGSLSKSFLDCIANNESCDDDNLHTGVAVILNDAILSDDDCELRRIIREIAPTVVLSNSALSRWCASRCTDDFTIRDDMIRHASHMLDIGQSVLGVPERSMEVTEGNMVLAMAVANNMCCIHQPRDASHRFYHDWLFASQELDLLKELSRQLLRVTSCFVPLAGAA